MTVTKKIDSVLSSATAAFAGVLVGFNNAVRIIAIVSLIFIGSASTGATLAMQIFLVASIFSLFFLNVSKSINFPIFSSIQGGPIAALLPAIIVMNMNGGVLGVFILIGATTIASGMAMIVLGYFNLGNVVRAMPYAVTTGFLASGGALLVKSAFSLSAALSPGTQLPSISPVLIDMIFPALTVLFILCIYLCLYLFPKFGVLIAVFVGCAGTYAALHVLDVSVDEGAAFGLFHGNLSNPSTIFESAFSRSFSGFDFQLIIEIIPFFAAAVFISVLGIILNSNGAEIILNRGVKMKNVLIRTGLSNILLGITGSGITYISASNTSEAKAIDPEISEHGSIVFVGMCSVYLLFTFVGQDVISFTPKFVSAGLLAFVGLTIVNDWLFKQYRKLKRSDWVLSLAIVWIAVVYGIINAIVFGLLSSAVIFTILYARIPVVKGVGSLKSLRSNVDRGPTQNLFIDKFGDRVSIVYLEGFLFFGTSSKITSQIKKILDQTKIPNYLILSFRHVSQVDASTLASLSHVAFLASSRKCNIVFTDLLPEIRYELDRSGLLDNRQFGYEFIDTIEIALEEMEDRLLESLGNKDSGETAFSVLSSVYSDPGLANRILMVLQKEHAPKGTILIRQGDITADIFLIDQGRLAVNFRNLDGRTYKVRALEAGSLVGEVASYIGLPRTADVVAESDAVVYRITPELMEGLKYEDPCLAIHLHELVAKTLAEKLNRTNRLLREHI